MQGKVCSATPQWMLALTWPGVGGFPPDDAAVHLDRSSRMLQKSRLSQETKVGVCTSLAKHHLYCCWLFKCDAEEAQPLQRHRCVLTARTLRGGSLLVFIPAL